MGPIAIPQLLTLGELEEISILISKSNFQDGSTTASLGAQQVKQNLQIPNSDTQTLPRVKEILTHALDNSPLFQIYSLPKHIYPIIVSKYLENMNYGWHIVSPVMGTPAMRTDLAMTVFLSDPASYEGGELLINSTQGVSSYKLNKGDAIVYPCNFLHCVNPVTKGERVAAVTWVQSQVASVEQRQILFELNQLHGMLYSNAPNSMESNLLLQTHSNLLRMWVQI